MRPVCVQYSVAYMARWCSVSLTKYPTNKINKQTNFQIPNRECMHPSLPIRRWLSQHTHKPLPQPVPVPVSSRSKHDFFFLPARPDRVRYTRKVPPSVYLRDTLVAMGDGTCSVRVLPVPVVRVWERAATSCDFSWLRNSHTHTGMIALRMYTVHRGLLRR